MEWEYRVLTIHDNRDLMPALRREGKARWELVAVIGDHTYGPLHRELYFKRAVPVFEATATSEVTMQTSG